ncbi:hypothetical protein EBZ39_02190 [bacterium]|nr:hypothetical protein [bacterium]
MTLDRDQFFGELFNENSEAAESAREQRQLAYEERTIKRVFRECGIAVKGWRQFVNECRNATGHQNLNFSWFNNSFSFPARLCGRRIPKLHELTIVDMFKPVDKNRLAKAVIRSLHAQAIDERKAFVFVFPVVRTMYCAHNLNSMCDESGVRWTLRVNNSVLAVESTVSLFAAIGPDWYTCNPS